MILPSLILLSEYKGNFKEFFEDVYQLFVIDFIDSIPSFRGSTLQLKKHPYIDGKEYTFYHFTHKGDIENERVPDLRRMERITWPRPCIENCDDWDLKVWPQKRNGKNRICIWVQLNNEPDYIIILDVRAKYILLWTAFVLEYDHEKMKKQKEYDNYLKTRTAQ